MNKEHIIFQMREALDELTRLVDEMATDPEFDETEFKVGITHAYHHLNTAWNSRHESEAKTDACSNADYNRWRRFPTDIDLTVGGEA